MLLLCMTMLIWTPLFCAGQSSSCIDEYPIDACRIFQSNGQCQTDVGNLCKVTCGKCSLGPVFRPPLQQTPPQPVTRPQPVACNDRDAQCSTWVASGYCFTVNEVARLCPRSCNSCVQIAGPTSGTWTGWGPFGSCSKACGPGLKTQYRTCIGTSCIGSSSRSHSCFLQACPEPKGRWEIWGAYGSCSVTCGRGERTRFRRCIGINCIGSSSSTTNCVKPLCAIEPLPFSPLLPDISFIIPNIPTIPDISDFKRIRGCTDDRFCKSYIAFNPGKCSESLVAAACMKACGKCKGGSTGTLGKWTRWGSCSKTCGAGTRTRTRKCSGRCVETLKQTEKCTIRKTCPKKPPKKSKWSTWGAYSSCTRKCGGGTKTKKRRCLYGKSCKGSSTSTTKCNVQKCKKRGWSPWSKYSKCTKSCGGGTRTRTRKCYGIFCGLGSSRQTEKCNVQKCTTTKGVWDNWGPYSKCTKTCGTTGTQTRKRKCKTTNCVGSSTSSKKCNQKRCIPSSSGSWSKCTKTCGIGTQYKFDSSSCTSASSPRCLRTFRACNKQRCPNKSCPRPKKLRYGSNHACCESAESNVQRIIGGDGASIQNWPWMILVLTGEVCAGTLIHRQWVLTAAHCLSSNPVDRRKTQIYAGIEKYSDHHKTNPIAIERVIIHPEFNSKTLNNDIALIELKQPLLMKSTIRFVDLPFGEETPIDSICYTTGWGVTHPDATVESEQLQKVSLQNFDMAYCRKQYKIGKNSEAQKAMISTTTKFLCAGSLTDNRDTCYGDSGGSLVCQRCSSCRWYIAGITTFGFPGTCGRVGYPGLYVKVRSYENWIASYVTELTRGRKSCPYKYGP
ncbi:uncharacterized protein LOC120346412 isoform X1 [Styela clava]